MKHILVVSQYFHPESFRINDIAAEWVRRGYRVTVLTGIPNYPKGEYYEGYSKTERTRENWRGIDIIRLPIAPRKTGSLNLIRNYLSFVLQGRKWIRNTSLAADLVFTYEVSPMTQALVSVWYAKRKKIPHILYVTDLWPENVEIITGIHNPLVIKPVQRMVDYIYKRSERILTSSESFIRAIKKRGIDENRIEFWPHYAEDFYQPAEKNGTCEIPDDGELNLVFAGNIGYAQGLGILPKAASFLKNEGIFVRFNLIGDGRYLPELKKSVAETDVEEYFNFIDRKPPEAIPGYLAYGDALLVTLSRSEVFAMTIPSKLQSCLACGRPLLVSADGEAQRIVREAGAGLVSDAEDVQGLADNIRELYRMPAHERDRMGTAALRYSAEYFNKGKLLNRIDEIFQGGNC